MGLPKHTLACSFHSLSTYLVLGSWSLLVQALGDWVSESNKIAWENHFGVAIYVLIVLGGKGSASVNPVKTTPAF